MTRSDLLQERNAAETTVQELTQNPFNPRVRCLGDRTTSRRLIEAIEAVFRHKLLKTAIIASGSWHCVSITRRRCRRSRLPHNLQTLLALFRVIHAPSRSAD